MAIVLASCAAPAQAQQSSMMPGPKWIFGKHCDPAAAILDSVAQTLQEHPNLVVQAIAFPGADSLRGPAGRMLWYAHSFLTTERGIASGRIVQLVGAAADRHRKAAGLPSIQFRFVPEGSPVPQGARPLSSARGGTGKYDEGRIAVSREDGRWSVVEAYEMCDLEGLDLAGFAEAVRSTPGARAEVILYGGPPPGGFKSTGLGRVAHVVRAVLVSRHGLRPDQVVIKTGGKRTYQSAELWVQKVVAKGRAASAPPNA